MGRALLSRIAGNDPPPQDEVARIVAHLRVLLNTRRGDAVTSPGFGVDDFSDLVHRFPEAISLLARSLRSTIPEFEPRLKNVSVRHIPDDSPFTLRFEILAQLAQPRGARSVRFTTTVRPGGHFDVES